MDELAGEVATASQEQSQGIAQVNTAVTQMDKVTQSNAATAEESAAAAKELTAQAESVKEAVADLLRLVGGNDVEGGREGRGTMTGPVGAAASRPQGRGSQASRSPAPASARAGGRRQEENAKV